MQIIKPVEEKIRLKITWDGHLPLMQMQDFGPLFVPRAYTHNLVFFCPTCGQVWATTEELPLREGQQWEPIKRGCCKTHAWHSEDHAGSLLLDLKFDLFTIGPEALKREVRIALNIET